MTEDGCQNIQSSVEVVRSPSDVLQLSGDGVFASYQGEGVTAGQAAVFTRLQNCNLACGRDGQGWRCDSWYTWDKSTPEYWQEAERVSLDDLELRIRHCSDAGFPESQVKRLIITGGEPLLQQNGLRPLIARFEDWSIEIETNGTIVPLDDFKSCQMNCSPKLASSGNPEHMRIKPKALRAICDFPNSWFKFVITSPRDISEMTDIVGRHGISWQRVILMGEGCDKNSLREQYLELSQIAQRLGCLATQRYQAFWFDSARRK